MALSMTGEEGVSDRCLCARHAASPYGLSGCLSWTPCWRGMAGWCRRGEEGSEEQSRRRRGQRGRVRVQSEGQQCVVQRSGRGASAGVGGVESASQLGLVLQLRPRSPCPPEVS
jgi:hypothetical protein